MKGYLHEGQELEIAPLHVYNKNDIIVFQKGEDKLVKRVVAVPYNQFQIQNGTWLVDGEFVMTNNLEILGLSEKQEKMLGLYYREWNGRVADDCYFVAANTQEGLDSRTFGPVHKDSILGKVITNG